MSTASHPALRHHRAFAAGLVTTSSTVRSRPDPVAEARGVEGPHRPAAELGIGAPPGRRPCRIATGSPTMTSPGREAGLAATCEARHEQRRRPGGP